MGMLAGAVISVYGKSRFWHLAASMPAKKHIAVRLAAAAVLGAASPITIFGAVPILAAFGELNANRSLISSFIITSVLINPNVFIYSFALGADMAVLRLVLCILAGIAGGLLVEYTMKDDPIYSFDGFKETAAAGACSQKGLSAVVKGFFKSTKRTAPNLALGILLAALFQVYFPTEVLDYLFSGNRGLSVLFAASLGVPAYYCGGGTIPLIKAWLAEGMSTGSAIAFMITGPATKITNLSAVKAITTARGFVLYVCYNIAFAVAAGIIADMAINILR